MTWVLLQEFLHYIPLAVQFVGAGFFSSGQLGFGLGEKIVYANNHVGFARAWSGWGTVIRQGCVGRLVGGFVPKWGSHSTLIAFEVLGGGEHLFSNYHEEIMIIIVIILSSTSSSSSSYPSSHPSSRQSAQISLGLRDPHLASGGQDPNPTMSYPFAYSNI